MHHRILFAALLVLLVATLSSVWTIANAQFAVRVHLPLIRTQSNQTPPTPSSPSATPTTPPTPSATPTTSPVPSGITTRVSVTSNGMQGNERSLEPSISADGRYVAFQSLTSNLVANDTNENFDVFVHDRQTGQTTRVSVASNGTQGNNGSGTPSISADGRYVAFESEATTLVANDTSRNSDIFVHDRQTGQTTRVSVALDGTQSDGAAVSPSISANGRYVAFHSNARDLVANDTNGSIDIFVYDRQTRQTTRVSVDSNGTQDRGNSLFPSVSGDGRYVAFQSTAGLLVANDGNGFVDVFVHDRQTGQTTRVSVASNGTGGDGPSYLPSISADGRVVAFHSDTKNLVANDTNRTSDIFVHDRQTKQTTRVSVASDGTQGDGISFDPSVSADGRYVAYYSNAKNLIVGDTNGATDIFVHDRQAKQTKRVSVASNGTPGDGPSFESSISADGRTVAFDSRATTLVANDTNGQSDVFVHDMTDTP